MKKTVMVFLFVIVLSALVVTCAAATSNTYVHPEALASTEWLAEHLDDPTVRVIAMANMLTFDKLIYNDTGNQVKGVFMVPEPKKNNSEPPFLKPNLSSNYML